MAAQQAIYLAKTMNQNSDLFAEAALATRQGEVPQSVVHSGLAEMKPFHYAHLGSMASVGDWKGVVDTPNICKYFILLCCVHLSNGTFERCVDLLRCYTFGSLCS